MMERKHGMRMSVTGAVVFAALALSGCAGTHVGDAWQCPLAQGKVCASVAAADPAVIGAAETERLAAASPLYRTGGSGAPTGNAALREDRDCDTGCNPLDWLASLFTGDDNETGAQSEFAVSEPPAPAPQISPSPQVSIPAKQDNGAEAIAPSAVGDPEVDDLREPETIGRVWIAPFVDADGVYREASWVRIVIAPAAWRLP